MKEVEEAEKNDLNLNYRLGDKGFPVKADIGDKCYVVWRGYVRGYHIINDFLTRDEDFICSTTKMRYKAGNYIVREGSKFHRIKPVEMKGFQGFRYKKGVVKYERYDFDS